MMRAEEVCAYCGYTSHTADCPFVDLCASHLNDDAPPRAAEALRADPSGKKFSALLAQKRVDGQR